MKYSDLEDFCLMLVKTLGKREIGIQKLDHEIAKTFGFTEYKMNNVKKALKKYNCVVRTGMADQFRILYPPETKSAIKKQINKELDKYAS